MKTDSSLVTFINAEHQSPETSVIHLLSESQQPIQAILSTCYRRAIFTRTHAQMNLDAMFGSLASCRKQVQPQIPLIKSPELQQAAASIVGLLDEIERYKDSYELEQIDKAKLQIIKILFRLAKVVNASFEIPLSLKDGFYFTREDTDQIP